MGTQKFPGGVWPVMLTPFQPTGEVDYDGLGKLVDWYIAHQCSGLFAVCQSSEMFFLSMEERIEIARAIVKYADKRVPVIACGNLSLREEEQIQETNRMAETGVDAVILVTNQFASAEESDVQWLERCKRFLKEINREIPLGFYECPYPYKRLISLENLEECARTGRFYFLKDTCCDLEMIKRRLNVLRGTNLELYNANSATLLDSLLCGAHGFSGVMANFHPELYAYLCNHIKDADVRYLQDFLAMASWVESRYYPMCAKYYLQKCEELPIHTYCRNLDGKGLNETLKKEMEMLHELVVKVRSGVGEESGENR